MSNELCRRCGENELPAGYPADEFICSQCAFDLGAEPADPNEAEGYD